MQPRFFDDQTDEEDSDRSVWTDSASRSEARERLLRKQSTNHRHSKIRAHIEHLFGDQRPQRNILVRTKGKVQAAVKIALEPVNAG